MVLIREVRNELECRTIHSRAGKQKRKYKNWLNIINDYENTENTDWKSINRVFILRNNTNEKEIKEANVKELNSYKMIFMKR